MAYSKTNFKEPLWCSNNVWYECRNRWVFSLRWNTGNDRTDVTSSWRLFQTLGPAEANGQSPTVTSRDGRMSSRLEDADLNRLRNGMSATRCSWSDKYRGATATAVSSVSSADQVKFSVPLDTQQVTFSWWQTYNKLVRESCASSRPTQPSIPLGSVNEYQLRLGMQRQVWLIPLADERGVCR